MVNAYLSPSGINLKISKYSRFGLPRYRYMWWGSIQNEQTHELICLLLKYIKGKDNISDIVKVTLSMEHFLQGIETQVLQPKVKIPKYIDRIWIQKQKRHLYENKMTINMYDK